MMKDPVLRTALLLKSAKSESELGTYGHHASGCTIDPNCPQDQVYIQQAQELLQLNIDVLC